MIDCSRDQDDGVTPTDPATHPVDRIDRMQDFLCTMIIDTEDVCDMLRRLALICNDKSIPAYNASATSEDRQAWKQAADEILRLVNLIGRKR